MGTSYRRSSKQDEQLTYKQMNPGSLWAILTFKMLGASDNCTQLWPDIMLSKGLIKGDSLRGVAICFIWRSSYIQCLCTLQILHKFSIFLIGCPLLMPWCPCPYKNKAYRPLLNCILFDWIQCTFAVLHFGRQSVGYTLKLTAVNGGKSTMRILLIPQGHEITHSNWCGALFTWGQ